MLERFEYMWSREVYCACAYSHGTVEGEMALQHGMVLKMDKFLSLITAERLEKTGVDRR